MTSGFGERLVLHLLVLVVVLVVVVDSWASPRRAFDDEDRAWPARSRGRSTSIWPQPAAVFAAND